MAIETSPAFIQANSYSAEITRRAIYSALLARGATVGSVLGGILNSADFALTAPGSGMSVNIGTGEAIVPGTTSSTQSGYYVRGSSTTNVTVQPSNPTNPRVDLVCLTVSDGAYLGSSNLGYAQVVEGTATAGATLTNLNGVASLPTSSLLLGYVLVPANASNIVTADILQASTGIGANAELIASGLGVPTVRTTSGTVVANETTISTVGGDTFTLPAAPPNGTANSVIAAFVASATCTVSAGANTINTYGTSTSSVTLAGGQEIELQYYNTVWYVISPPQAAPLSLTSTQNVSTSGLSNTSISIPTNACTVTFYLTSSATVLVSGACAVSKTTGTSQNVYAGLLLNTNSGGAAQIPNIYAGGTGSVAAGYMTASATGGVAPIIDALFATGYSTSGVNYINSSGSGNFNVWESPSLIGAPVAVYCPGGTNAITWGYYCDASGGYAVGSQILSVRL